MNFEESSSKICATAEKAGCLGRINDILKNKDKIISEEKQIVISGGKGSGKSTFLNIIAGLDVCPKRTFFDKNISAEATFERQEVLADGKSIPFNEFNENRKQYFDECNDFKFLINNEWMHKSKVSLAEIESSKLLSGRTGAGVSDAVRSVGYAVYIISGLMPLTKTDVECITCFILNGIPCRVLISRLDIIETEEERNDVLNYIQNQLDSLFDGVKADKVNLVDESEGKQCADSIKEWVDGIDDAKVQDERLSLLLIEAVNEIRSYSGLKHKEAYEIESERSARIKEKQDDIERKNVFWQILEQNMTERRLNLYDDAKAQIEKDSGMIAEFLISNMNSAHDKKEWWKNTMPKLLQNEFMHSASHVSGICMKRMEGDYAWLLQEIRGGFGIDAEIMQNPTPFKHSETFMERNINLKNPSRWVIVSRVGAVIAVAAVITLSPGGIIFGAASAFAGYSIGKIEKEENQGILESGIKKYVHDISQRLMDDLDGQLKSSYDAIINGIRQYSLKWQRETALLEKENMPDAGSPKYWEDILKECDEILKDIF